MFLQETDLNVVPGGIIPVMHVSQYDVGRELKFVLYSGYDYASLESGTTVTIEGTKPDGHGFQYSGVLDQNAHTATFVTTEQMTVLAGAIECKLTLYLNSQRIGTALFILDVEKAGINDSTIISDTELPLIIAQATEQMERAEAAADAAALSETNAATSETNAATSETNAANSEIICGSFMRMAGASAASAEQSAIISGSFMRTAGNFADEAEASAASANVDALKSEGHALGTQNGTPVSSDSPYYHNNAKYWADEARQSSAGGVAASVIATAEPTNISSHAYAIGEQFVYNGILYTATSAISVGATITPGTNCSISDTITEQIGNAGHTILDEDGITYPQRSKLQFEGCEVTDDAVNGITVVKCEGSGGSKISISTNETTLHGKTVTITGTSETKTATFDNTGKAEIDGFMETGTATVTATDGTETATATLSIPYFGNYTVTLSFWAATLSITTDSPELYGQTITVKDSNNQTVATSVFSGQGTATSTVNSTGTYTVSATADGVTVTESVTVSAQTTYNVSLHLWTATVSISTSSSELYSATITVKKGGSTVGTTSFSVQGSASYNAHETGTYTFECTYSGQTYSDSVTVSAETSYSATINTSLILSAWLTAGNVTGTYADFSEVEADEKAIRKLMTIHAAVDYLATCASATDSLALSIINSDICAKWINLRDYALDTLYTNTYLAAMMDTADKYFYGEWVITDSTTTPPTWGAKGNVPVMTTASAPYGTAFGSNEDISSAYSKPYMAFDGDDSTLWSIDASHKTNIYVGYIFNSPIRVNRIYYKTRTLTALSARLEGSNDTTTGQDGTWADLGAITSPTGGYIDISNVNYYKAYRFYIVSETTQAGNQYGGRIETLQFYGRTLKVSVPVMTSNTAPYGEASASTESGTSTVAWKIFDGDDSTNWSPVSSDTYGNARVTYKFTQPILPVMAYVNWTASGTHKDTIKIQGSNDGSTWTDLGTTEITTNIAKVIDLTALATYQYCSMLLVSSSTSSAINSGAWKTLQFYGLNYSEYDWDADHPRKYLYDHGVELETCVFQQENTTTTYEKTSDSIIIKNGTFADFACDFSLYDLLRMVIGTFYRPATYSSLQAGQSSSSNQSLAYQLLSAADKPYHCVVDVSAISVSGYAKCLAGTSGASGDSVVEIEEMWLE